MNTIQNYLKKNTRKFVGQLKHIRDLYNDYL